MLFINGLHVVGECSTMHHIADDTNMLLIEKSLKKNEQIINRDLKRIDQWIRTIK